MAEKKSIYEEALLDINTIQEALNANTKEILRSVAREEIAGLVKESLNEDDYEEETIPDETDGTEEITSDEEPSSEIGGETEEPAGEFGGEADDTIQPSDEVGGDDQDSEMDADALDGDELDMTGASDDDVIAIYKKLSGEDEIEVVGDEVHMNISEPGEYIIKKDAIGGESEMPAEFGAEAEPEMDAEIGVEDDGDDEMSYEIAMDDDSEVGGEEGTVAGPEDDIASDEESDDAAINESEEDADETEVKEAEETDDVVTEEDKEDEDMVKEAIPVGLSQSKRLPGKVDIGQPRGAGARDVKESTTKKAVITEAEVKYKKLLAEATQLKNENEDFRKALKKFRTMLVETVVFNSNLSYVAKLFMEHSTTKDEKKQIIQRFDEEVTNLKESKRLYKSIVNELSTRKPMNEAIDNKLNKEVTTGNSKQLNEATAYVDPSTQRIKDLINRVENR